MPALGVIILTLFVMEDYCYSSRSKNRGFVVLFLLQDLVLNTCLILLYEQVWDEAESIIPRSAEHLGPQPVHGGGFRDSPSSAGPRRGLWGRRTSVESRYSERAKYGTGGGPPAQQLRLNLVNEVRRV